MSEQIREQVSAFLDGELPGSETELLLKRLTRDPELRESFGRYALVGECLRGGGRTRLSQGFTARVNRAIDGEPLAAPPPARERGTRWWRSLAGVAVAAGVATVAVVALQQRTVTPSLRAAAGPPHAALVAAARPAEALSYTVPAAVPDAPAALPAARLTNYVFAHAKYSAVMGQNDVLNDLLAQTDVEEAAARQEAAAKGAHDGSP